VRVFIPTCLTQVPSPWWTVTDPRVRLDHLSIVEMVEPDCLTERIEPGSQGSEIVGGAIRRNPIDLAIPSTHRRFTKGQRALAPRTVYSHRTACNPLEMIIPVEAELERAKA
jgi:hypothetical protein